MAGPEPNASVSHPLPSKAWTTAYAEALASSEELARASTGWNEGALALVFASTDGGGDAALIELSDGTATVRHLAADQAREEASLVLEASIARWRELALSGIDPVKFLMQGKLALAKGRRASMIREIELTRLLLLATQRVATAR